MTITLLKAEPDKTRETWWRAPLKGLENRRAPPKPADPEMVSTKQGAGGSRRVERKTDVDQKENGGEGGNRGDFAGLRCCFLGLSLTPMEKK